MGIYTVEKYWVVNERSDFRLEQSLWDEDIDKFIHLFIYLFSVFGYLLFIIKNENKHVYLREVMTHERL